MTHSNPVDPCCTAQRGATPKTAVHCPSCGKKGKAVKPITIDALVTEQARARVRTSEGFRFCAEPSCDVAYFHDDSAERFLRGDVRVRIGQKENASPRVVCYCFDHTVEEIEAEVVITGTSTIADTIGEKCKQGLDRCEETNPQGSCCLGNVRALVRSALETSRALELEQRVTTKKGDVMETILCRTCGCSLVRLGISENQAAARQHDGVRYPFCCEGCADLFVTDPVRYLRETEDWIVCPTCLAEKPMGSAVTVSIGGKEVHFCRCPYCLEMFKQDPDFYARRLQGAIPNEGVLDHQGCCVKPPSG